MSRVGRAPASRRMLAARKYTTLFPQPVRWTTSNRCRWLAAKSMASHCPSRNCASGPSICCKRASVVSFCIVAVSLGQRAAAGKENAPLLARATVADSPQAGAPTCSRLRMSIGQSGTHRSSVTQSRLQVGAPGAGSRRARENAAASLGWTSSRPCPDARRWTGKSRSAGTLVLPGRKAQGPPLLAAPGTSEKLEVITRCGAGQSTTFPIRPAGQAWRRTAPESAKA